MKLEMIAAELGLDVRTVKRVCASIAESFVAAGIDLPRLTAGEVKFVAAVIVVELQEKCHLESDLQSSGEHAQRATASHAATINSGSSPERRAGHLSIPRRWSKP